MTTPQGFLAADDTALRFDAPTNTALDLLIDGRRVWSLGTDTLRRDPSGHWLAPWPEPIRRRLDGQATLTLRTSQQHELVAEADAVFGSGRGRVEVVDSAGRPVALHKWGRLQQPFEAMDREAIDAYLDFVDGLMKVLADECGVPAFMSFGALLGATRSGRLIGHDVDIDIGYFSDQTYPLDVMRESFRIERVLRQHGWRTVRDNGGFLQVFAPAVRTAQARNVDIFTCWSDGGGTLFQINDICTTGDRSTVLPLQQVELEGRLVPAPRDIEAFLTAAYGPNWRVPDPTFSYEGTPARRRMRGWTGGLREERSRWRDYWAAHKDDRRRESSDFARVALRDMREQGTHTVLDVGCGAGADALYFAEMGLSARGYDAVRALIRENRTSVADRALDCEFDVLNLGSVRDTLAVAARAARGPGPRAVFARHLVDELSRSSQPQLWRFCSMVLRGGGRSYLEFTVGRGGGRSHPFSDRHPMPVTPRSVRQAVARYGAVVLERSIVEQHDDGRRQPRTCRMTLEWP